MLCLAILRLLQQSPSTAPLPARSFADSLAHLVASMAGEEAEKQIHLCYPVPLYMLNLILSDFCSSEYRKYAVTPTDVLEHQQQTLLIDAGSEVNAGRLHVALLALESIGAVRRIGYGHSALYAASTSCNSSSQMLRQQDGELILQNCQTLP